MAIIKAGKPVTFQIEIDGKCVDINFDPPALELKSRYDIPVTFNGLSSIPSHTTNEKDSDIEWRPATLEDVELLVELFRKRSYEDGLISGYIDGCIIDQPLNTGEHTYSKYLQCNQEYLASIYNPYPTSYQIGYGNGFDLAAIYTSASHGQHWAR